jgi:hypothetical protein
VDPSKGIIRVFSGVVHGVVDEGWRRIRAVECQSMRRISVVLPGQATGAHVLTHELERIWLGDKLLRAPK